MLLPRPGKAQRKHLVGFSAVTPILRRRSLAGGSTCVTTKTT